MAFLPDTYEREASASQYMKLQEGKNKFRILSSAIVGWEYWTANGEKRTPNRVKTKSEVPLEVANSTDYRKKAKEFWAFVVLNHDGEQIQILEVTQATIMAAIEDLVNNEEWGDPKEYDITITKTKTGAEDRDVEYSVVPSPKKPTDAGAKQLYEDMHIRLEALFENADPFKSTEPADVADEFEKSLHSS